MTFEEAEKATEEMFEQQGIEALEGDGQAGEAVPSAEEPAGGGESGEEAPSEGGEADATMQEAINTAEAAAEAAAQKDEELQGALARIAQLEGTIAEMSAQREEQVAEEMLTPPTLDIDALSFADEETRQKAMTEYA